MAPRSPVQLMSLVNLRMLSGVGAPCRAGTPGA